MIVHVGHRLAGIIGKGGAKIKALERQSGARMHGDFTKGALRVSGTAEHCAAARALVQQLCAAPERSRQEARALEVGDRLSSLILGSRIWG